MIMDGSLLGRYVACGREKEEGEEEGRGSITDTMNGFVFGGWLGATPNILLLIPLHSALNNKNTHTQQTCM